MTSEQDFCDQGVGIPDRLERLWAPYRMNYIVNKGAQHESSPKRKNPFVEIPQMSDEEGLIVARGELVYCVLNLYPYNSGHMMVVPYRQEPNLENLSVAESAELMAFAQTAVKVLKRISQPDACNVGFNLGRSAGGSVGEHLHLHIVPRWNGDANFMTVIEGTKVLPQLLRETRSLLAQGWASLVAEEPLTPGVARA
ncbi:HIT domain-containing protein [Corynebacterium felinum]|uniref:ATP adenylyltransferase n=1 Tax=Corynebacterium felinum TaxID=131318 RepID=A0ABU2BAZ2_9CORY|nr:MULTISPECIES: HIT domain-containing protein [Corynebacterium]MDF5821379.1 HIT domain-containing protein [Corynebacterium felinum]MDO4760295.1 HIT domain-containing protein [Corynebacterium sp.]MDR7355820.1 ATP adenylyltransferase [Corynebacterium felinum]WJY95165.1 AP-4-A phosphorylase [Corynebacterium felinum]